MKTIYCCRPIRKSKGLLPWCTHYTAVPELKPTLVVQWLVQIRFWLSLFFLATKRNLSLILLSIGMSPISSASIGPLSTQKYQRNFQVRWLPLMSVDRLRAVGPTYIMNYEPCKLEPTTEPTLEILPVYIFYSCRKGSLMYRQYRMHHTLAVSLSPWRNLRSRPGLNLQLVTHTEPMMLTGCGQVKDTCCPNVNATLTSVPRRPLGLGPLEQNFEQSRTILWETWFRPLTDLLH